MDEQPPQPSSPSVPQQQAPPPTEPLTQTQTPISTPPEPVQPAATPPSISANPLHNRVSRNKIIIASLVAALIVIIIAIITIFISKLNSTPRDETKSNTSLSTSEANSNLTEGTNCGTTQVAVNLDTSPRAIVDSRMVYECMAKEAKKCAPAYAEISHRIALGGSDQITYQERVSINKTPEGACEVVYNQYDVRSNLDEQMLAKQGFSNNAFIAQYSNATNPRKGSCTFASNLDVESYFSTQNELSGVNVITNPLTSYLSKATCTGDYFQTMAADNEKIQRRTQTFLDAINSEQAVKSNGATEITLGDIAEFRVPSEWSYDGETNNSTQGRDYYLRNYSDIVVRTELERDGRYKKYDGHYDEIEPRTLTSPPQSLDAMLFIGLSFRPVGVSSQTEQLEKMTGTSMSDDEAIDSKSYIRNGIAYTDTVYKNAKTGKTRRELLGVSNGAIITISMFREFNGKLPITLDDTYPDLDTFINSVTIK